MTGRLVPGIAPSRYPPGMHHPGYTPGTGMTLTLAVTGWPLDQIVSWGSDPSLNSVPRHISGIFEV